MGGGTFGEVLAGVVLATPLHLPPHHTTTIPRLPHLIISDSRILAKTIHPIMGHFIFEAGRLIAAHFDVFYRYVANCVR